MNNFNQVLLLTPSRRVCSNSSTWLKKPVPAMPIGILLLCLLAASAAAAMPDLFSAEVLISDESAQARSAAVREGLKKVLIKASGHRQLGGRSGIESVLEKADDYVQEFRYRSEPAIEENSAPRRWMWMRFDRRVVEQSLQKLGLALWESGRPEVLVWLGVERKGNRQVVDPEKDASLLESLQQAAGQRGLPLVLPLMDLEDRGALQVSDLWTTHRQSIAAASARYGLSVVLVGRLIGQGSSWRAKWTLYLGDQQQDFDSVRAPLQSVLQQGVDETMDRLAVRYVPAPGVGDAQQLTLRILGVRNLGDYSRVMQLLRSLDVLTRITPRQALHDELVVEVQARGGEDAVRSRLSLEDELQAVVQVPDDDGAPGAGAALSYRLK